MISFHDSEIVSLSHDKSSNKLLIGIETPQKEKYTLSFNEVYYFDFDSFGQQNVIFDILSYSANDLPDDKIENFNVEARFIKIARQQGNNFYLISASVGLEGCVIGKDMEIMEITK